MFWIICYIRRSQVCTGHFIILMVLSAFMISFNLFDGRVSNPLNLSPYAPVCVRAGARTCPGVVYAMKYISVL